MEEIHMEYTNNSGNPIAYATEGSAGIDLPAATKVFAKAGRTVMVPTGIKVHIPDGYAGVIMSRSGLGVKKGCAVAQGVGLIDSDYRGELFVPIYNREVNGHTIMAGDRIAQLVIMPVIQPKLIEVNQLKETVRGDGGFGSTGE